MVAAYILALESGVAGEAYVLGSGQGTSIETLLQLMTSMSAVQPITIVQDPAKVRANDISRLVVDPQKFQQLTQWQPTISLATSIRDILDYWRNCPKESL